MSYDIGISIVSSTWRRAFYAHIKRLIIVLPMDTLMTYMNRFANDELWILFTWAIRKRKDMPLYDAIYIAHISFRDDIAKDIIANHIDRVIPHPIIYWYIAQIKVLSRVYELINACLSSKNSIDTLLSYGSDRIIRHLTSLLGQKEVSHIVKNNIYQFLSTLKTLYSVPIRLRQQWHPEFLKEQKYISHWMILHAQSLGYPSHYWVHSVCPLLKELA